MIRGESRWSLRIEVIVKLRVMDYTCIVGILSHGLYHEWFSNCNLNSMENLFLCNSNVAYHIAKSFAHAMTAQLSCHVQHFIAIFHYNLVDSRKKFLLNLNYDAKIVPVMAPRLFSHKCNGMKNIGPINGETTMPLAETISNKVHRCGTIC